MSAISEYLSSISGIAIYPIIAFIIFFLFFILMLLHTYSIKEKDIEEMKRIPLDNDDDDNKE